MASNAARKARPSAVQPVANDALVVEQWGIERLKPYGGNPRKNDNVVDRMCDAIREFGFRIPIVARSDGLIVDGHLRYKAAMQLGIKSVPVALADSLSDTQIRAFRLLANESASWAQWDVSLLRFELTELAKLDYDLKLTGFEDVRLATFIGGNEGTGDPDAGAELDETAITAIGDTWLLGKHRLTCGDSANAKTVKAVLGADKPKLMATDPPYNLETEGGGIFSDMGHSADIKRADIGDFAVASLPVLLETNVFFTSKVLLPEYLDLARSKKLTWDVAVLHRQAAVPNHNNHLMSDLDYIVLMGKIAPKAGLEHADYSKLFSIGHWDRPVPWAKPVELIARLLRLYSLAGDVVFDPYAGSGTTIIAAESVGRVCLGIDRNPIFVDLAVRRWQKWSGRKATLQGTRKTFDHVEKEKARQ
jgi:ParB-like chromosome segregation protein Spo0J